MKFKDFSLGTKQKIGFGIILTIMTGATIFSIIRMASIKEEIDEITNNWMPRAIVVSDLNLNTAKLRIGQLEHAYTFDKTKLRIQEEEIINLIDEINNNIDSYEKLKGESEIKGLYTELERSHYNRFLNSWELYQDLSFTVFALSRQNEKQKAVELLNSNAKEIAGSVGSALSSLVSVSKRNSLNAANRASSTLYQMRNFTIAVLAGTIVLSIILATALVRRITDPIAQLGRAAGYVARGDYRIALNIDSKDEIGTLGKLFEQMTTSLREAREKIERDADALKNQNEELENTMNQLKETEKQLVQSEKMASLGQLTAGVAHEINNPVNFVIANVNPLRKDIDDLLGIIKGYENTIEEKKLEGNFSNIEKVKSEVQYSLLIEEIENLLKGIEEGGKRTADIVRGLRNFSRLDEGEMKLSNINEGMESTLLMLKNDFKNRIIVEKNYGEIPDILCYPGKLNQVFMNILLNAKQAISDKGNIFIKTYSDNSYLYVSIRDNGEGMSEETRTKIFDPFFTTKDVGKGTGLGLSISYGIVQDHNGDIEVKSKINEGTEFLIKLPLKQQDL